MKQTFLSFVLALLPIIASADAKGTCGKNVTWSYVEATQTLTISGTGEMKKYYAGYTSKAPWYSYRNAIQTAVIESGVTSISSYAFCDCSSMTSVTIPSSVTSIEWSAFEDCSSLTSVTIPNSVTNIEGQAFLACTGMTSLTISNSVKSIEWNTFAGCWSLTSLTIPGSVTSIGESAFQNCIGLTSLTIPSSVTTITEGAFGGCRGLISINVEIGNTKYDSRDNCNAIIEKETNTLIAGCRNTTIPNDVARIGAYAFAFLYEDMPSIIIPSSVTSIGAWAFKNCRMPSIIIPSSVMSIEEHAFDGCIGLTSITIPNGVTSISEGVFRYCDGLNSITIPKSVTDIGDGAFSDCGKLADVYCYAEQVPSTNEYAFTNTPIENWTLHVPEASVDLYKGKAPWKNFKKIVKLPISGDSNGDGVVDTADIVEPVNYIMGTPDAEFDKKAADVNNDGVFNVVDIVEIVKIIISLLK